MFIRREIILIQSEYIYTTYIDLSLCNLLKLAGIANNRSVMLTKLVFF